MKTQTIVMSLLGLGLMASCSSDEAFEQGAQVREIRATLNGFKSAENTTRTTYNIIDESGFQTLWAKGDILGIYPIGGDQVSFPISEGAGSTTALFDGGTWALRGNCRYAAYYPFSTDCYTIDQKAIPVSYIGQVQEGNNSTAHLSAVDFMAAAGTQPSANGSVNLQFNHVGCFLRMQLTMPVPGRFTSLTLSADEEVFTTQGTVDLSAATPALTPTEKSSTLTLYLKNVQTTEDNQTLTFYMMVAPDDLSGKTLTISVQDARGKSYKQTAEGKQMEAAYAYSYTLKFETTGTTSIPYLTFTSEEEQQLKIARTVPTLQYSVNGGEWKELVGGNYITFGGANGELRVRGKSTIGTGTGGDDNDYSSHPRFIFSNSKCPVSCSGDIRTLVDYQNYAEADCSRASFPYLFYNCKALTSAPELPATSLASYCYYRMFDGCTSLTTAPALPATKLAWYCYRSMFDGCTSLTTAPALPATELASSCYWFMFEGCTSLTTAPALPATELADYCYWNMFSGCTSLTTAPALPATELAHSCYYRMFDGCTSLTTALSLPATELVSSCYDYMFSGCTSLTTAPSLPATELVDGCYYYMFYGCTSLTTAPALPATELANNCYRSMFEGCHNLNNVKMMATTIGNSSCIGWLSGVSSTGTFIKNADATWDNAGIVPNGWTVVTATE